MIWTELLLATEIEVLNSMKLFEFIKYLSQYSGGTWKANPYFEEPNYSGFHQQRLFGSW